MFKINEICFSSNEENICINDGLETAVLFNQKVSLKKFLKFFMNKEDINKEEIEVKIKLSLSDEGHLIIPSKLKVNNEISPILNKLSSNESIFLHKNKRGVYYLTSDGSKVTEKGKLLKLSEWSDDVYSLLMTKLSISLKKNEYHSDLMPLYDIAINNLNIIFLDNPKMLQKSENQISNLLTFLQMNNEGKLLISSFEIEHPIFGYKKVKNIFINEEIFTKLIDDLNPSDEDKELLEELVETSSSFEDVRPLSLYIGTESGFLNKEFKNSYINAIEKEEIEKLNIKDSISLIIDKNDNSNLRVLLEKLLLSTELIELRKENISLKDKNIKNIEKLKRDFEIWKEKALIEIEKALKETKRFFSRK